MSRPHTPEEVAEVSAMLNAGDFEELEHCKRDGGLDVAEHPVLSKEGLAYFSSEIRKWKLTTLGEQVMAARTEPEIKAAEWEEVAHEKFKDRTVGYTARLPVPGGWLYRTEVSEEEFAMAAVFVPDPEANR